MISGPRIPRLGFTGLRAHRLRGWASLGSEHTEPFLIAVGIKAVVRPTRFSFLFNNLETLLFPLTFLLSTLPL